MSRHNGEDIAEDKALEPAGPAEGQARPGEAPAADAAGVDQPAAPADEAAALRRERDELRELLLRKRAEFENYRKRVERDRSQAAVDASAQLLRALVPILDNFERALKADSTEASLRQGVELIHRELLGLLEAQGVVLQDPTGQPFDPQLHQALSHEPAPGHAEGTIVEVFQKGYVFKDRLLRPALVKVAKGEEGGDGGGPEAVH